MLYIPEGKTCFVGHCDSCPTSVELDEDQWDDAASDMRKLGWLPFPRTGLAHDRWPWKCPACLPARSTSGMPTTPVSSLPPDSDDERTK